MGKKLDLSHSTFIHKYVDDMSDLMKQTNPEWDIDDIKEEVFKIVEKEIMIPNVTLDNNYTKECAETNLVSVFDWVLEKEPIIAGNGTFFKRHEDAINPIADMLDDWFYGRKAVKKEMFSIDDVYSRIYAALDLDQVNLKNLMNSYYGSSGAPTSAFFNLYTAASTTLSAQSVISTTEQTFEAFLADNYDFINLTECFEWLKTILSEDVKLDDWVKLVEFDEVYERLKSKIIEWDDSCEESLKGFLYNLTPEELTRVFYKNNLIEFTKRHENVRKLHTKIFKSIKNYKYMKGDDISVIPKELRYNFESSKNMEKDWNKFVDKQYFYDPNDVPDTIKEYLVEINNIYMKYVYVQYLSLDKIYRLKNFKRKVVTVIDTDSNILSLDTWINYLFDEILGDNDFGREYMNNVFIAVNSITYVITNVVEDILLRYGECSNVEEKWRPRFNMKNEFFFSKLIIGNAKKRYISKIMLREGNYIKGGKTDVKGFDFVKATTSEHVEKKCKEIINNVLLKDNSIDLKALVQAVSKFREEIKESINNGEKTYLPNANAKELEAYKEPGREASIRGVLAWNACMPDNQIALPSKVSLVKLTIEKPEDIEDLKETEPEVYEAIMNTVFNDKSGIFITTNSKGKTKVKGMQVLAIPSNDEIPKWALPYINYSSMINTIMSPFKGVLEIFKLPDMDEGKTGQKTKRISNIIKF